MNIGIALKNTRKELGFNQQELSKKAKISQTALSQIENGLKSPTAKTLQKICDAMGIPISIIYILGMDVSDVPEQKKEDYNRIFPYVKKLVLEMLDNKFPST